MVHGVYWRFRGKGVGRSRHDIDMDTDYFGLDNGLEVIVFMLKMWN